MNFKNYGKNPSQNPVNKTVSTMNSASNTGTQNYNSNTGAYMNAPAGFGSYTGDPGSYTNMGVPVNKPLRFDPYTGSPIYGQQPANGQNIPGASGSGKMNMDTVKKIMPVVAVAVVAVVIGIILLVSFGGVKSDAKKFAKALLSGESEKAAKMFDYDMLYKVCDSIGEEDDFEDDCEDEEEFIEYYDKRLHKVYKIADEYFEDEVGNDYKISYEVTKVKDITIKKLAEDVLYLDEDDDEFDDFIEDFENKKAKKVVVKATAKDGDDKESIDITLYYIKDGGWKLIEYDIDY